MANQISPTDLAMGLSEPGEEVFGNKVSGMPERAEGIK